MAKNYKHLSLEERVLIEDRLNFQKSIRSIAKELGKSPSTILREIRNHSVTINEEFTDCLNRKDCNYRHLCGKTDCKNFAAVVPFHVGSSVQIMSKLSATNWQNLLMCAMAARI